MVTFFQGIQKGKIAAPAGLILNCFSPRYTHSILDCFPIAIRPQQISLSICPSDMMLQEFFFKIAEQLDTTNIFPHRVVQRKSKGGIDKIEFFL